MILNRKAELNPEKAEQARRTLIESPMTSDSKIAHIVGCAAKDVGQIRAQMKSAGELEPIHVDEDKLDDI